MVETQRYRDGAGFEDAAGYSRAVRRGQRIEVSGTTVSGSGPAEPGDTERQTREALQQAIAAVESLGGQVGDIVRTRLLLLPGASWEGASAAHAQVLGEVAPANTTVYVAGLIGDGALVEVEVSAEVGA